MLNKQNIGRIEMASVVSWDVLFSTKTLSELEELNRTWRFYSNCCCFKFYK